MGHDYGGVVGLAQTALALNMAYIALGRFRYRTQIRDLVTNARSQTKEFDGAYTDDRAWLDLQRIEAGNDPRAWTVGRMGYWIYFALFHKSVDIVASYILAVIAVSVIGWRAYGGLYQTGSASGRIWPDSVLLETIVFGLLIAGVVAPVAFVLSGRYAVRCASRSIEDNMDHLVGRYRNAASEDVDATLEKLGE